MPKVNTFNYDTVASWNGAQDLFVVEQPDGTKVATPAMVKQFIEAGDFEATGEVKDGHGNILKDMAKSADVNTALAGKQDTLTFDDAPTASSNNPVKSGGVKTYVDNADAVLNTAIGERVKIAAVSGTVNADISDLNTVGGYRTGGSSAKALSSFTGYPTGKTVVGWSLSAYGVNGATGALVNIGGGYVYVNSAYIGSFTVSGFVFYKD